jgi:GH18 family chitinase
MPADGHVDPALIPQEHIELLEQTKKQAGCRILLSVGGWNRSENFPQVASDPMLRDRFIREARDFCLSNGIDGVDYDWEHPKGPHEVRAYIELVKRTRAEFRPRNMLVTIAQAGWQKLGQEMYAAADRIHLMAYDHDFPQATMEKSSADVERLLGDGCPSEKIVLGVPFYGRNKPRAAITYSAIVEKHKPRRDVSLVEGYAFNGPDLVAAKARYARENKLGGIMIWELGQDTAGASSLLKAIAAGLRE